MPGLPGQVVSPERLPQHWRAASPVCTQGDRPKCGLQQPFEAEEHLTSRKLPCPQ
jgi:hypothetical protein